MSMENCVSEQQKLAICTLLANQQRKKASSNDTKIYHERKNDNEFWLSVAENILDKLIQNEYCEGYHLRSRGLVQGKGFNLEIDDDFNKEKFYIYTDGSVSDAMDYTPDKGIGLDGFQIFLIIMIVVYLIAFIISGTVESGFTPLIIIALGIANLYILFNC